MAIILNHNILQTNANFLSIIDSAKDYAMQKGFTMRPRETSRDVRVHLPFCLVPSLFPAKWFWFACEIQPEMNLVLHKVAHSKEFLKECLSGLIEVDDFIKNIFEIFEAVYDSHTKREQVSLGLIRSDYLLSQTPYGEPSLKQVENNTIASGFCGISPIARDLHLFILKKFGRTGIESKLPINKCDLEMSRGMKLAWDVYGNPDAVIIFVVEEATFNISDQRILEYQVMKLEPRIRVMRLTFVELRSCAVLKDEKLFVKGKEVALVYYRDGYAPDHYEPEDWETRLLIERSQAIKCPSVGYQLAGTKRVQCYLAQDGILERFTTHEVAQRLRQVFAFQCFLNEKENNEAISSAIQNPELYVLKPEREGGGNNLYGRNLKNHLLQIRNTRKCNAYILMQHLNPLSLPNCIIRSDSHPKFCSVVSELGTYGAILGSLNFIHANYFAGHLLRSREEDREEGGVAAGFGALDSCILE
ncbi:glutathione synthetase-like [Uloborus diversus]|uniref:glutathione synthetase-like n=1 Tax=Uloborus diversus TaxID=327109 RepID=UPI002409DE21|nr:glutathione synthetase-like [Uloborus diversus]